MTAGRAALTALWVGALLVCVGALVATVRDTGRRPCPRPGAVARPDGTAPRLPREPARRAGARLPRAASPTAVPSWPPPCHFRAGVYREEPADLVRPYVLIAERERARLRTLTDAFSHARSAVVDAQLDGTWPRRRPALEAAAREAEERLTGFRSQLTTLTRELPRPNPVMPAGSR